MTYKYLFGPIPSRRLGLSLGIDLVPYKFCNLNCVYCESGRTTKLTNERKDYISSEDILRELNDYLAKSSSLDYITFSGAGEPLLNSEIGKIITYIKENYPENKIALITNGVLLSKKEIREEILKSDVIMPSLDAAVLTTFRKINRPLSEIKLKDYMDGLVSLRREFSGKIWLEIFIVPDLNDSPEDLRELSDVVTKINPDEIHLNTLDRPGTEPWVKAAADTDLDHYASYFYPLKVKIFLREKIRHFTITQDRNTMDIVLGAIKRRPCTKTDLLTVTGLSLSVLNKILEELQSESKIEVKNQGGGTFYSHL